MPRKRMIDPGFWIDEKLGRLEPTARLLFMGLISNADDEGRLPGHPALIKSQIFPYDINITVQQVEKWLSTIQELGIIIMYVVDGQTYIQVKNFCKHQTINRPSPSKYPSPPECSMSNQNSTEVESECNHDNSVSTHGNIIEDSHPKEKKRKEKEIEEEEKRREESNNMSSDDDTVALSPYREIVDLYNSMCVSLPKVVTITDKRKRTIRARWKKHNSLDLYEKLFAMAEESDFLSGRNGKWSGCNFDWLMNENNMVKVLEGNYQNKESPHQNGPTSWNALKVLDEKYKSMGE